MFNTFVRVSRRDTYEGTLKFKVDITQYNKNKNNNNNEQYHNEQLYFISNFIIYIYIILIGIDPWPSFII